VFTFIDQVEDLSYLNEELKRKEYVGVDTEFRRTTKENMRLALLQINDEEEIYLIDAIAINNPKEYADFLFSDSVTKIFHSCKEDIEAIYSWTNKAMCNVFDTQIANALLNGDYSIGYQGLVREMLGINLEKKETRSNWIKRPLSDAQLKYAALDVEYLIYLYKEQLRDLISTSKLYWHNQDTDRLIRLTLGAKINPIEVKRTISRHEEAELLRNFNIIVNKISVREQINPTLFLSKKIQKDILRVALQSGVETACDGITEWRSHLVKSDLLKLLS
jgi:ribonuclease D